LAVKRAQLAGAPIVLGSATPSLESWARALDGKYTLLRLPQRAGAGGARHAMPQVATVDVRRATLHAGLAEPLIEAVRATVTRGEQALIFINRRGYAPVIACDACGWLSQCPRCSVFAAFHKSDRALHCHHCGWRATLPRSCPTCGNQDLHAVGQGTQRIEETLRTLLPDARIGRIDRDSTRRRHAAAETFDAVHAGEIDVLVGTQMIAKGHDFRRVSLVGILNADAQLVAHDFRAPERLFATLVQVAGRAGRSGLASRVLVQTRMPDHPLFAALAKFDYEAFARAQLAERRAAGMPPYAFQALLGAEAKSMDDALAFLERARDLGRARAPSGLRLYEPVPRPLARLAGVDRGQLLIEANQRTILQRFLTDWLRALRVADSPKARWHIEVDPQEV
jgi:primosomal protein N' (replication factor Y)